MTSSFITAKKCTIEIGGKDEFLAGDADDLTLEVNKAGKISPGGWFYYSYFTAFDDTTITVKTYTKPNSEDDAIVQDAKVFIVNKTTGLAENIGTKDDVTISISNNVLTIDVPYEYVKLSKDSKLLVKAHYKPPKEGSEGTTFVFETLLNGFVAMSAEVTVVKA